MELTVRSTRRLERPYFFTQSQRIIEKTACIGYLRTYFDGNGTSLLSYWNDLDKGRTTDAFKEELNGVIQTLRSDKTLGSPLKSCGDMIDLCCGHSECILEKESPYNIYGFRVNTDRYSYMLRMNPNQGEYNLYCYCYERHWLDRHLQGAERGIRFVGGDFIERFRIADGDSIRLVQPDGNHRDVLCRYIDSYNVEMGWRGEECYHILEFAKLMEQSGNKVIPIRSSLPTQCCGVNPHTGEIVLIRKGESGCTPTGLGDGNLKANQALVSEYNKEARVLPEQAAAMLAGALYGWDKPEADPINYDSDGRFVKPKNRYSMER